MATKHVALGTVIAVDVAGGSSFTTITLAMDATPPARKRVKVDQTALSDTLATFAPGIEDHSEYKFNQYWHPTDSQHASLDTIFGTGIEAAWKITYPFSTPILDTFNGWVSDLEPATLQTSGMIMRGVAVQRTTALTRA
jgi:hypothetical protein